MRKLVLALTGAMLWVGSAQVQANECELTISGNDQMRFDKSELTVPAGCTEVTLTLEHGGKLAKNVMGHNWVLSKAADKNAVTGGAIAAGLDNQYVPDSDKVIAATDVIGGGESTSITFSVADLSADEEYEFYCTFPGHWSIMTGKFVISG